MYLMETQSMPRSGGSLVGDADGLRPRVGEAEGLRAPPPPRMLGMLGVLMLMLGVLMLMLYFPSVLEKRLESTGGGAIFISTFVRLA